MSETYPISSAPFARTVRHFSRLNSTNTWAIAHSAEFSEAELPLLVVADVQDAGRGRSGRSWYADRGTLTFSLVDTIERLALDRATVPRLALAAGLSVAEAIDDFIPPITARIKWPNDIYVAGGKVAGLLVESCGVHSERVVIGIGINVTTELGEAPVEVRQRARSLATIAQRPLEPRPLLFSILERMRENLAVVGSDFSSLARMVQHRCLLTGNTVTLQQGQQSITGHCLGIDGEGALRIEVNGTLRIIRSGEIVRLG